MRQPAKAHLAIATVLSVALYACGGDGSTGQVSVTSVANPSSTPTPPATSFPATGGECDGTAGWQAIPNDGLDDTVAITNSLQQAANKGDTLVIPAGIYNINAPGGVSVALMSKDFAIIATGATFIAGPDVNADLIGFDAVSASFSGPCGGPELVDVRWSGGEIDISQAHLSGTVPQGTGIGATTVGSPVAGTTDGFSIRGATGGTAPRAKAGSVTIRNLTVVGAPISDTNRNAYLADPGTMAAIDSQADTWRNAGGDSGIFVMGAGSALIENSTFFGIRDASIYMSAAPYDVSLGGNYVIRNNRFYGGFDGISSKRGAQNITMDGNVFVNVVRGVSTESLSQPLRDTNEQTVERIVQPLVMTNNVFNGVVRAIQVEAANDVTVSGNLVRNLGARVAQSDSPTRYSRYEGIVFEGVTNGRIDNNQIRGIEGSRAAASNTVGVVIGSHAGIAGRIDSANNVVAANNLFTNLDSDTE